METQFINLNMTPTGINPTFHIAQYDVGRLLGFYVYNGSEVVDLDGYTCTIEATRTDGTQITADVITTDNQGVFAVTAEMSNVADKYDCQLVIIDSNANRFASLPFIMDVITAALNGNAESISEDRTLYQQYNAAMQAALANEANNRINADNLEKVTRQSAVNTLQNNINTETTERINSITLEAETRQIADETLQTNINTEASTRATQDSLLQSQINQIIAPSGEAPSAAEVQNARIGADGVTYDTLGNAIRGQVTDLKSALSDIDDEVFDKNYVGIAAKVGHATYTTGWRLGRFLPSGAYMNDVDGMRNPKAMNLSEYDELFLSVPGSVYIAYVMEYTSATISTENFSRIVFSSQNAKRTSFIPVSGKFYAIGIQGLSDFTDYYTNAEFLSGIKLFTRTGKIEDLESTANELVNAKKSHLEFNVENNKYIAGNGLISDAGSTSYNVAICPISGGETLEISASTNYTNPFFAYFDENMVNVKMEKYATIGTSATENLEDYISKAPTTARYIAINFRGNGVYANAIKHNGKKIKGKYLGKKWVCVGDSLTTKNKYTSIHYYDFISDNTDINPYIMGVNGSGYARKADTNEAFYQRVSNIPTDADVITLFGSFNDLGAGLDLGTVNDSGTTTLAGCINATIDNIQTLIPTANIGIVAPTPWSTTRPSTSGNAYNYVEMLKAICERRSIPFLDLWRESNLRPWDADFRPIAYSKDGVDGIGGTHPNEIGHKLIAPRFEAFLDSLLLH
jgi:lysophospholipase L1-like esterase